MAIQATWNENHFVNFNRSMVELEHKKQSLIDTPKRASEWITDKLLRLNHIQHQMDVLNHEEEVLKEDIKAYMGSCSLLVDASGTPLVSYKSQSKTVLDTAKLKAAYPALYAEYSRQTTSRPFKVI